MNEKKNKERLKKSILRAQKEFNFFDTDRMRDEIEEIHIFYEDCRNCSERRSCPTKEKVKDDGIALMKLHEFLEDEGLDTNLHPLTSEDNKELGKVISQKGGVLPVSTKFGKEMPFFSPEQNFLMIEFEDGRKYLYTLDMFEDSESDEVKAPLMYR